MATLTHMQSIEVASAIVEAAGFSIEAYSGLSEARYYRLPGKSSTLRIACHPCRHPDGVAANLAFNYQQLWDSAREEYICDTNLTAAEVVQAAQWAIEEYLANAEDEETEE